jgi:hypothetical protein
MSVLNHIRGSARRLVREPATSEESRSGQRVSGDSRGMANDGVAYEDESAANASSAPLHGATSGQIGRPFARMTGYGPGVVRRFAADSRAGFAREKRRCRCEKPAVSVSTAILFSPADVERVLTNSAPSVGVFLQSRR